MNSHERLTLLRQRSAALALTQAPQSLAVRAQLAASGATHFGATGAINWPEVEYHPDVNDGMGDFVAQGFWKVGDRVGSHVLGPIVSTRVLSDDEIARWGDPEA